MLHLPHLRVQVTEDRSRPAAGQLRLHALILTWPLPFTPRIAIFCMWKELGPWLILPSWVGFNSLPCNWPAESFQNLVHDPEPHTPTSVPTTSHHTSMVLPVPFHDCLSLHTRASLCLLSPVPFHVLDGTSWVQSRAVYFRLGIEHNDKNPISFSHIWFVFKKRKTG